MTKQSRETLQEEQTRRVRRQSLPPGFSGLFQHFVALPVPKRQQASSSRPVLSRTEFTSGNATSDCRPAGYQMPHEQTMSAPRMRSSVTPQRSRIALSEKRSAISGSRPAAHPQAPRGQVVNESRLRFPDAPQRPHITFPGKGAAVSGSRPVRIQQTGSGVASREHIQPYSRIAVSKSQPVVTGSRPAIDKTAMPQTAGPSAMSNEPITVRRCPTVPESLHPTLNRTVETSLPRTVSRTTRRVVAPIEVNCCRKCTKVLGISRRKSKHTCSTTDTRCETRAKFISTLVAFQTLFLHLWNSAFYSLGDNVWCLRDAPLPAPVSTSIPKIRMLIFPYASALPDTSTSPSLSKLLSAICADWGHWYDCARNVLINKCRLPPAMDCREVLKCSALHMESFSYVSVIFTWFYSLQRLLKVENDTMRDVWRAARLGKMWGCSNLIRHRQRIRNAVRMFGLPIVFGTVTFPPEFFGNSSPPAIVSKTMAATRDVIAKLINGCVVCSCVIFEFGAGKQFPHLHVLSWLDSQRYRRWLGDRSLPRTFLDRFEYPGASHSNIKATCHTLENGTPLLRWPGTTTPRDTHSWANLRGIDGVQAWELVVAGCNLMEYLTAFRRKVHKRMHTNEAIFYPLVGDRVKWFADASVVARLGNNFGAVPVEEQNCLFNQFCRAAASGRRRPLRPSPIYLGPVEGCELPDQLIGAMNGFRRFSIVCQRLQHRRSLAEWLQRFWGDQVRIFATNVLTSASLCLPLLGPTTAPRVILFDHHQGFRGTRTQRAMLLRTRKWVVSIGSSPLFQQFWKCNCHCTMIRPRHTGSHWNVAKNVFGNCCAGLGLFPTTQMLKGYSEEMCAALDLQRNKLYRLSRPLPDIPVGTLVSLKEVVCRASCGGTVIGRLEESPCHLVVQFSGLSETMNLRRWREGDLEQFPLTPVSGNIRAQLLARLYPFEQVSFDPETAAEDVALVLSNHFEPSRCFVPEELWPSVWRILQSEEVVTSSEEFDEDGNPIELETMTDFDRFEEYHDNQEDPPEHNLEPEIIIFLDDSDSET